MGCDVLSGMEQIGEIDPFGLFTYAKIQAIDSYEKLLDLVTR